MTKTRRQVLKYSLVIVGIVLLAAVVIDLILVRQSATLDQRIAEFEAKRKIPDSENAAIIYNKVFKNYDCNQIELSFSYFDDPNLRSKPWSRNDYPKVLKWLKEQERTISEIIKASKFEKCCFPIPFEANSVSQHTEHIRILRNAAVILTIAANNHIAEGRLDDAIEKYRCIIKIGQHICQQPLFIFNSYAGWNIEALSLEKLNKLILERNINEQQLNQIEEFPVQTQDMWENQLPEKQQAEKLYEEKQKQNLTYFQRIQYSIYLMRIKIATGGQLFRDIKDTHQTYLRYLMIRRANRIVIGLRRYKNQNGKWPESLEQIKPLVDPNVLVDPWNNGSFVYKLTDDGFTLYSRGPNNIDEGGKYNTDKQGKTLTDDWMIWPTGR